MAERKMIYLDDAMLKIAKVDKNKYADMSDFHDACVDCLKNLPSADRPQGEWIPYLSEGLRYKCSECESRYDTPWNFCPNCGSYNGGGHSEND